MIEEESVVKTEMRYNVVYRNRKIEAYSPKNAEMIDKSLQKLDKFLAEVTDAQKLQISNLAKLMHGDNFYFEVEEDEEDDFAANIPRDFAVTDEMFYAIQAQCPAVTDLRQFLVYDGTDVDAIEYKSTLQGAVDYIKDNYNEFDEFEIIDLDTLERYEIKVVYEAVKKKAKKN